MRHPCPTLGHGNVHIRLLDDITELLHIRHIVVADHSHSLDVSVAADDDRHGVLTSCAVLVTWARAVSGEVDGGILRVGSQFHLRATIDGSAAGA